MGRAWAAAAVAALALGGCGGGGSPDDPKSAIRDYINAFSDGNGAKVCSLMTAATRDQFVARAAAVTKTKDCGKALDLLSKQVGPQIRGALKGAKVSEVKVTGDRATAKLTSGASSTTATLVKEGGAWKVSGAPGTR
jgi:hypothetical protein